MQNSEEQSPINPFETNTFPPPIENDDSHAVRLNRIERFSFHGTGLEYFGIWIVNILLVIVTLGLYSPWAKVRRLRYFYGNTELVRRRFDFTGVPTKILVGRLIALGLYFAISILSNQSREWMLAGALLIWVAVPWLIRATLRFNARNSKFANARFYFSGTNKAAYWVFVKSVLLMFLTLGLAFPVVVWMYKKYCFEHLYVGQLKFRLNATWLNFMSAMYIPFIAFAVFSVVIFQFMSLPNKEILMRPELITGLILQIFLVYIVAMFVIWPWVQARLFIKTWNNVVLSRSKFQTDCSSMTFVWIVVTNWILRILTLGLLTPWAAIRLYRYKVESLSVYVTNDPNIMMNQIQKDHSAIAEEISDIFDLDISL